MQFSAILSSAKVRKFIPFAWLLVVALVAVALFWETPAQDMPYTSFDSAVEAGSVESVEFADGRLYYSVEGDQTLYRTDDPELPTLKERLLLQGVQVTSATSGMDVVNFVLDIVFDVMIFGFIGFGLYKLLSYNAHTFKVVRKTGVTFDDIAGMSSLKREMRQTVDVLKNPGAYGRGGVRQIKGVVLEGPPGNGKTLFAKALAQEAGVSFIATKGADFQSAFMSLGARKIRMLFRKAAKHRPCIVFIDEFDSIGERRNYAGTGIDKENNRIITAMLNEMDGFTSKDGILVVAATNSYKSLDPALVRPGRFDLKYTIANPDAATRRELVKIYSVGKNLSAELTPDVLAPLFEGSSCAAIEAVLNEASMLAMLESSAQVTVEHIVKAAEKVGVSLVLK